MISIVESDADFIELGKDISNLNDVQLDKLERITQALHENIRYEQRDRQQ